MILIGCGEKAGYPKYQKFPVKILYCYQISETITKHAPASEYIHIEHIPHINTWSSYQEEISSSFSNSWISRLEYCWFLNRLSSIGIWGVRRSLNTQGVITMSYLNYFFVYFCLVSIVTLQGVPQNMTLARQLENRLRSLNLFVTFSRQPTISHEWFLKQ